MIYPYTSLNNINTWEFLNMYAVEDSIKCLYDDNIIHPSDIVQINGLVSKSNFHKPCEIHCSEKVYKLVKMKYDLINYENENALLHESLSKLSSQLSRYMRTWRAIPKRIKEAHVLKLLK